MNVHARSVPVHSKYAINEATGRANELAASCNTMRSVVAATTSGTIVVTA